MQKFNVTIWLLLFIFSGIAAQDKPAMSPALDASDYQLLTPQITPEQLANFAARAEKDDPVALDALLFCNLYGLGKPMDAPVAVDCMERGCRVGSPLAMLYKGKCLQDFWL